MDLDDDLCICFHVSKRKVLNYLRVQRPQRCGQLADCFGAGTGCGWCRPFLQQLFAEAAATNLGAIVFPSRTEYLALRREYLREQPDATTAEGSAGEGSCDRPTGD